MSPAEIHRANLERRLTETRQAHANRAHIDLTDRDPLDPIEALLCAAIVAGGRP